MLPKLFLDLERFSLIEVNIRTIFKLQKKNYVVCAALAIDSEPVAGKCFVKRVRE